MTDHDHPKEKRVIHPTLCSICTMPMPDTAANTAAGAHVRCRYAGSAIIASGATDADLDAIAIRGWRKRRAIRKIEAIIAKAARRG